MQRRLDLGTSLLFVGSTSTSYRIRVGLGSIMAAKSRISGDRKRDADAKVKSAASDDIAKRNSSRPCRFFAIKSCKKGSACTFAHEMPEKTGTSISVKKKSQAKSNRIAVPCLAYFSGECEVGENCEKSHTPTPLARRKQNGLCKFSKNNFCRYGIVCPYLHPAQSKHVSAQQSHGVKAPGTDELAQEMSTIAYMGSYEIVPKAIASSTESYSTDSDDSSESELRSFSDYTHDEL